MFTYFFYLLKSKKVPVSMTEWMTFMEALDKGCVKSLDDFYFLSRAILVKSESYFDQFDRECGGHIGSDMGVAQGPAE